MTSNEPKKKKRRVQTQVSEDIGARLDRLAEVIGTKHVPGAKIDASIALRAALHVGIAAEEKRLGLPPLDPLSETPAPARSKRKARPRSRVRRSGSASEIRSGSIRGRWPDRPPRGRDPRGWDGAESYGSPGGSGLVYPWPRPA